MTSTLALELARVARRRRIWYNTGHERSELQTERDEVLHEREVLGCAEQEAEGRRASAQGHVIARAPGAEERKVVRW